MRKGFTMIELIFVIVILGILAAVAIPKLTATRDDAQVATGLSEISMAIRDIGSFYTARGDFNATDISDMTNVNLTVTAGNLGDDQYTLSYSTTSGECVDFALDADDGNISVTANGTATDTVCTGITGSTNWSELQQDHIFGGATGIRF